MTNFYQSLMVDKLWGLSIHIYTIQGVPEKKPLRAFWKDWMIFSKTVF